MKNEFFQTSGFPDFALLTPSAAREALPVLLERASAAVDALEKDIRPGWDGLMAALHDATRPAMRAWGLVSHLLSVCNSEEWRAVQRDFQPDFVKFSLRVSQSHTLYNAAKRLLDCEGASLTPARRRILGKFIADFELSGVALEGEKRRRFNEIQEKLAELEMRFRDNVLDATKEYSLETSDPALVDGLPDSLRTLFSVSGDPVKGPWKITIDDAAYPGFMRHAKNRDARREIHRARSMRASSGKTDNTGNIASILELRREQAAILGFGSYAELSLSQKTARTIEAVDAMSGRLAAVAVPASEREYGELKEFAAERGGPGELAPWDIAYWAERMREAKYGYEEEELAEYFDFPQVLNGLFSLAARLFGVKIEAADGEAPVWHPDVRFFRVTEDGETVAHFYLDPYSRPETKSGGAWMNEIDTREVREDGTCVKPLALIVCNQRKPAPDGRSPMLFREVETLFHEFGHALQHMLSRVDDPEASGINLVDWDAVEIASQFMENWCTERTTLASTARHSKTGAPLPEELLQKVAASKKYRAGSVCARQLAFAQIDMDLHSVFDPARDGSPNDAKNRVFDRFLPRGYDPRTDRFLHSFSHIFGGGYAAGYYSYKWSEVMSADVFGAFEDAGLDNEAAVRETGRRYRETFLALGGSKDPMEVFREFRGRAPSADALLRQSGLTGVAG